MARTIRTCKTVFRKKAAITSVVSAALAALTFSTPAVSFESDSRYGSYLAGRYAAQQMDVSSAAYYFQKALSNDPQNESLLQQSFLLALSDGRIRQAVDHAFQLVQINNDAPLARIVLATTEMSFEEPKRAQSHLELAKVQGPIIPIMKAWTLAALGQVDDAITQIDGIADNEAISGLKAYTSALIYQFAGRTEEADLRYRQALQLRSAASYRLVASYGRFLERTDRLAEAQTLYQGFLAQSGHKLIQMDLNRVTADSDALVVPAPLIESPQQGIAELFLNIAALISESKNKDYAGRYLQLALHLYPDFEEAHFQLAEQMEDFERWADANAHYARLPLSSPLSLTARIRTALNLYNLEQSTQAIQQLKDLLDTNPGNPDILLSIADLLRSEREFDEAVPYYDQVLNAIAEPSKQDWPLFYHRGVVLEQAKQWDRAEKDFLKALELHPEQPLVLNYLGYSWVEKKQHLDQARKMIERAVQLRPRDGYIVDSLGWVLYRLGDFEGAVTYLEKAVLLRPEDPTINDHLGDAYWKVNRRREAYFQWSHALASDPDDELKAKIKAKLENGFASGQ